MMMTMTYHPFQIIGLLIVIFQFLLLVSASTPSTTTTNLNSDPVTVVHKKLDLSYLHRTKSTLLASGIRQTLKNEQQQQAE